MSAMSQWFAENGGTLVVSVLLIALVTGVIVKMIRDRKKGKLSCGCDCGCCAMRDACHKKA